MIEIKKMYISTHDIKSIEFDKNAGPYENGWMIVKYRFDDEPIKIFVNDFEEYEQLANLICNVINTIGG